MTEDNCRIGYTKSQAWILKVLLDEDPILLIQTPTGNAPSKPK